MKYLLFDTETGNVVGRHDTLKAARVRRAELADPAIRIIWWTEGELHIDGGTVRDRIRTAFSVMRHWGQEL